MRVAIYTLGCKVNQYETQAMEQELVRRGHTLVPFEETADAYIERLTHDIGRNFAVRVVTSDSLIQLSALRAGVLRVSAREFREETDWVLSQIDEVLKRSNLGAHKTRDAVRRTDDGK